MNQKRCSCGAQMYMVPTGKVRDDGRLVLMPLNVEDVEGIEANVVIDGGVAKVVPPGEGTHQPHHASCANVDRWRDRARTAELTRESRTSPRKPKPIKPPRGLDRLNTALPGL